MDEKNRRRHAKAIPESQDEEQQVVEGLNSDKSATLLIADADSKVRQRLHDLMIREGFGVIEAATGVECLAKVYKRHLNLVLLTVRLPDKKTCGKKSRGK